MVNSHGIVGFAALQEEIAYTLGYTDMANFRRAFKRWEAMPPSRYRAAQDAV